MKKLKLITSLTSLGAVVCATPIVATSCSKGDTETITSSSLACNRNNIILSVGTADQSVATLVPTFWDADGDEVDYITPEYTFETQPYEQTNGVEALPNDAISFWSNEIIIDSSKLSDSNIGIHKITVSAKAKGYSFSDVGTYTLWVAALPKEINNIMFYNGEPLFLPNDIDPTVFCGALVTSNDDTPVFEYNIPLADGTTQNIKTSDKEQLTNIFITSCSDSVSALGNNFLAGFTKLEDVDLSGLSKIKTVGNGFLSYCPSLQRLDLSSLTALADGSGFGSGFLYGDTILSKITWPNLEEGKRITINSLNFLSNCAKIGSIEWKKLKIQLQANETLPENFLIGCTFLSAVDLTSKSGAITVDSTGTVKPIANFTNGLCDSCKELATFKCDTTDDPILSQNGTNFFNNCTKLTKLDLLSNLYFDGTVTTVGDNFLANCSNMYKGAISMDMLFGENYDQVTAIGNNFLQNNPLKITWFVDASLPALTTIGDAFLESTNIKANETTTLDLTALGTNITSIGKYFLRYCWGIVKGANVKLPVVKANCTIGWDFMGECINLQSTSASPIDLTPLANVVSMGEGFMYNCHNIEYLNLGKLSNLTTNNSFGAGICFGCEKLSAIDTGSLAASSFQADVTTAGEEAISFALTPIEGTTYTDYPGIEVTGTDKTNIVNKFGDRETTQIWRKVYAAA